MLGIFWYRGAMKVKGNFINSLKRISVDTRFILCLSCVFVWWIVLPSAPGCYLVYMATPWGQASVLFIAALILWVKHPISWLFSIALSVYIFYLASVSVSYDWKEFAFLPRKSFLAWGESEGWGLLLFRFMWRDLLVCAFAALIIIYAGSGLVRSIIRFRQRHLLP
jgi:hypothetical protein